MIIQLFAPVMPQLLFSLDALQRNNETCSVHGRAMDSFFTPQYALQICHKLGVSLHFREWPEIE
jgi:hypothetical protein